MDDPALAFILQEALALLDAGEEPESITARFPDVAEKLLPLLQLATTLRGTAEQAIYIPVEFLQDLGEQLQEQVQEVTD